MKRVLRLGVVLPMVGVGLLLRAPVANAVVPAANGRIVFSTNRADDGSYEIWSMKSDGSDQTDLTNNLGVSYSNPVWSPDGTQIAFDDGADIFVMNADGGGITNLTNTPPAWSATVSEPAWSPDDTKIMFAAHSAVLGLGGLVVMNANGTNGIGVTSTMLDHAPAWSPDGTKVVFSRWRPDGHGTDLYVMQPDGSGQTILTASASGTYADSPAWSPDNTKISYTNYKNTVGQIISVMNADGSGVKGISRPVDVALDPAWSPDGTLGLFSSAANGSGQISTVSPDLGVETNLSNSGSDDVQPDWQPVTSTCPQQRSGTWIGSWSQPSASASGTSTASVTMAGDVLSGTMTFVTGTQLLVNGQALTGTVSCFHVSVTAGPVTLTGSLLNNGSEMGGTYSYPAGPGYGGGSGFWHSTLASTPVATASGNNLTTDTGGTGATAADPLQVSVQDPLLGPITIEEATSTAPGYVEGYELAGQLVHISTTSSTAANPLHFTFEVDSSVLAGRVPQTLAVFRNGVFVLDCAVSPTLAAPDPCVASRTVLANGNVVVTVLTSQASVWEFGLPSLHSLTGVPGPPDAPVSPSATAGASSATVSWTAPAQTGNLPLQGYTVTAVPGGQTCTATDPATSCVVSGLDPMVAYTFDVTATNMDATTGVAAFVSAAASTTSAIHPAAPPDAPVSPSAVAGNGSATVSWTAPAFTGNLPLQGYTVTAVPGGQTCVATAPTTSCVVSGLDPFGSYTFGVTATNQDPSTLVAELTSTVASTTTPVHPTASPPGTPTGAAGDSSVRVTWAASAPPPSGGYTVSTKQGTHVVAATCATMTVSCVVPGLTNGLPYTFTVTALFNGGSTLSGRSAAVVPKIIADLQALNSAPVAAYRDGAGDAAAAGSPFTVTEGVHNNSATQTVPAGAKLVVSSTNAAEVGIGPDAGLDCSAAPTPVAAGFTQTCVTTVPLSPGATLSASVSLNPQPLPPLRWTIVVRSAVSLPVTVPATTLDPTAANNAASKTVKVIDRADLVATSTGNPSVARSAGTYAATETISNTGPDPVYAKFTITVVNALEAPGGLTADPTLIHCADPVANSAGTGYSRVCTTLNPLAPAASIPVQLTLVPSSTLTVHKFTVTGTAASVGGYVVEPNKVNNRAILTASIT